MLIDTGASVNLVRKGLFPESYFLPAKNPVQLTTANGQLLCGGNMAIKLRLTFGKVNGRAVQPWKVWGEFFEAETRADMILGYPWLAENQLAVIPKFGCMALMRDDLQMVPIHSCPEFGGELEKNVIETGRAAPPSKKAVVAKEAQPRCP